MMTLAEILEKVIPPILVSVLNPKINDIITKAKNGLSEKVNELSHDFYENKFNAYLSETYTEYYLLETLIIPNQQMTFDTIYVPLTIQSGQEEIVIDSYPEQLFSNYFRIIIQDSAGMGKSMILRKIFLETITNGNKIPILIDLRRLNEKNDILKEFINQLNTIDEVCEESFVRELIKRGDFIFLFDGFDEIAISNKEFVLSNLRNFTQKASNNYFIITSRPEESLCSFGSFKTFNIKGLDREQSFKLFKNYDIYNLKPIADNLITLISNGKYEGIDEYLKNPFLSSLLYKTYEYRNDISTFKPEFFRWIFDSLFDRHDLSKKGYLRREKYSGLHIDKFDQILRYIANYTSKQGRTLFAKDEILYIIQRAKNFCIGIEFNPSDFLKDLVKNVPLFKEEGIYYCWAHKSLQDYFAARFINQDSKDERINLLIERSQKPQYTDIIDIYASIDFKDFRQVVLKSFINQFIDYYDYSSPFYVELGINESLYKRRIEFIFTNHYYIKSIELKDNKELTLDEIRLIDEKMKLLILREQKKEDKNIKEDNFQVNMYNRKVANFILFIYWTERRYFPKYLTNRFKEMLQVQPNMEVLRKTREFNSFILNISKEEFVSVRKTKSNIVNNSLYFSLVNTLLQFSGGFVPNYEKYISLQSEIKETETLEKNKDKKSEDY